MDKDQEKKMNKLIKRMVENGKYDPSKDLSLQNLKRKLQDIIYSAR